jgi:endonuclease/exonuclease/phosphatase family metal-dependent hydrolase
MRALTFNVYNPKNKMLYRLASFIRSVKPDVIGLQEITEGSLTTLSRLLNMNCAWKGSDYLGNGLLSRGDIHNVRSLEMQTRAPHEMRSALYAETRDMKVVITHLDHVDEDIRLAQWGQLMEWAPRDTDIIMGDLNTLRLDDYTAEAMEKVTRDRLRTNWEPPRGELIRLVETQWAVSPFQKGTSRFDTRVDYILHNPARLILVREDIHDTRHLSDHMAVCAELRRLL